MSNRNFGSKAEFEAYLASPRLSAGTSSNDNRLLWFGLVGLVIVVLTAFSMLENTLEQAHEKAVGFSLSDFKAKQEEVKTIREEESRKTRRMLEQMQERREEQLDRFMRHIN